MFLVSRVPGKVSLTGYAKEVDRPLERRRHYDSSQFITHSPDFGAAERMVFRAFAADVTRDG
jgi:hypothetical protein